MPSQALNTTISIFRNVRSYRNIRRHESVEAIIKRLRPLIMSVPSKEFLTGVLTRDTTTKDFSVYTEPGGFPIVVGQHGDVTFAQAQENMAGVDFSFSIGSDRFLTNTQAGLTTDLQANLRALLTT